MKKEKEKLELQPLLKGKFKVKIKGLTPLLTQKIDWEVIEEIELKKQGKFVKSKAIKSKTEKQIADDKVHYDDKNKPCIPTAYFLNGMVEVAPYIDGLDKKRVAGSIRLSAPFVPLKFKDRTINVTWGRQSGMTRAPTKIVRPEFREWECEVEFIFNKQNITAEQIVNLLNWAGFQIGAGSWRPQCKGSYGQYEVMLSK